ncbi:MAG: TRAP transporter small permease subunit [Pseudomonadota bacterium]
MAIFSAERLFRLAERIDRLVNGVGRRAAWLLVVLMAVILFDVVTRRFLVLGSTKLQELEWHLHGALFLLCLGYAYLQSAHVRIEVLRERMGRRTQAWVELGGALILLLPYALAIVAFGVVYAMRAHGWNEGSAAQTGLGQRWIIKAAVPLGFSLLGLAGVSMALKAYAYLFGAPSLAARSGFEDVHMTLPHDEADPDDGAARPEKDA